MILGFGKIEKGVRNGNGIFIQIPIQFGESEAIPTESYRESEGTNRFGVRRQGERIL